MTIYIFSYDPNHIPIPRLVKIDTHRPIMLFMKTTLAIIAVLFQLNTYAAEVSVGTDGVSLAIDIPTVTNLQIKVSGLYLPITFPIENGTKSSIKTVTARAGLIYGDRWKFGVFYDKSQAIGWVSDISINARLKEKVSVNNISFYAGYSKKISKLFSINLGAQIMPFVSYRIIGNTGPYSTAKEINDMRIQSAKYRIGNTYVLPVINLSYRF